MPLVYGRYFVAVLAAAVLWLCLLAAYANQTVPNEWGTTKPWNFPCLVCCGNNQRRQAVSVGMLQEELLESAAGDVGLSDGDSEGVSLRIMHLRKVFGAGGCCKRKSAQVCVPVYCLHLVSSCRLRFCTSVIEQKCQLRFVLPTRPRMMETVPPCIKVQQRRESVQRR